MWGGRGPGFPLIEPILTAIAAKVPDGPCCAYMGPGSAGHYVKMVHNGCEYAMMQLIAESYDVLRTALGLSAPQLAEIYGRWNDGNLTPYPIHTTPNVL